MIRSKRLAAVCFGIACWTASSVALAQGSQGNGLQRFVTAHAATMARYCDDAVAAGEVMTLAFANGYATAIKVGAKAVGWLSCRKALPAATRWAAGEEGAAEPVIQVDRRQLDYLADVPEPEQLPVEIGRVSVTSQEGEKINALPATSVQILGSYAATMRRIDPNWVPPDPQPPLPSGAWRIDILPGR